MCVFFDGRDGERSSVCYSPLTGPYRVDTWWRHKIWEIVRLGGLIKKKTKMKKAQLSWINMLVQIGGEILATLCSNDSTQNLLKLALILPFWILEGFYNPALRCKYFTNNFLASWILACGQISCCSFWMSQSIPFVRSHFFILCSIISVLVDVQCFAPFKGIRDNLGFWIPRCGLRIPVTGFQSLSVELGFWIPIIGAIPDSLNCIPDSKTQDCRFQKQKFAGFRIPSHGAKWLMFWA